MNFQKKFKMEIQNENELKINFLFGLKCRNFNIRFVTKCEMQRPMRPRVCLGVKHTFTNGGKCKG
jgi:hypothetical protein